MRQVPTGLGAASLNHYRNPGPLATFAILLGVLSMADDLLAQLVSPEVHPDCRVTFRLRSPHATKVLVKGIEGLEAAELTRAEDNIWSVTLGPLQPGLYGYLFEVDGTDQLDLHNRHVKKWLSLESMFEIPGNPPLLHERWPVDHGTTHRMAYVDDQGIRVM